MSMTCKNNAKKNNFIYKAIEECVPQNHLVRKLESSLDFNFIYPLVKPYYSSVGRASIDPVVLFKMIFINIVFGLNSMRKTTQEIEVNLAYRWFLGMDMDDKVPHYSTWSQNYLRRYQDSEVFNEIFEEILNQCIQKEFIDFESVFGDSTHQKANANKNKGINVEVELIKKKYDNDLLDEINQDRLAHGKKAFDSLKTRQTKVDEFTGEVVLKKQVKQTKQSPVDPESGVFHKGEKEKCYAYSHQTFCDKNGYVLVSETVPGNVHDNQSFFTAYEILQKKFPTQIENICLDAGYYTPAICREIMLNNHTPYLPYLRPKTKKGFFKKYDYVYDEEYDCYLCPSDKIIKYSTTNREGYRIYVSDPQDCLKCPLRKQCTESKNHQKIIARHVWEHYKEEANHIRHTDKWKEVYPIRKQSIERVFADGKEKHGLRYTRLKGLKKNQHQILMIFGCHNLKKMALFEAKRA